MNKGTMKLHTTLMAAAIAMAGGTAMAQDSSVAGDPEAGEKAFKACAMCHTVEAGKNKLGPSLHNIVDSEAGAVPRFRYSKAMADSGIVWTVDELDRFLEKPAEVVPGTKMAFVGVKDAQTRADLIAYLQSVSE